MSKLWRFFLVHIYEKSGYLRNGTFLAHYTSNKLRHIFNVLSKSATKYRVFQKKDMFGVLHFSETSVYFRKFLKCSPNGLQSFSVETKSENIAAQA